jgi:hypothetical protein
MSEEKKYSKKQRTIPMKRDLSTVFMNISMIKIIVIDKHQWMLRESTSNTLTWCNLDIVIDIFLEHACSSPCFHHFREVIKTLRVRASEEVKMMADGEIDKT